MYVAKIKTFKKMYKSTFKKTHVYHDLTMLGYYLAGVCEEDGHTKKIQAAPQCTSPCIKNRLKKASLFESVLQNY